jgi:lipid-binding SYLF domain-containing protein
MKFHRQNRFLALTLAFAALMPSLLSAQSTDDREQKVREAAAQSVKAGKVFDAIMKTPDKAIPKELLAHAKAIAVFPQVIKAAFFIGGEGGAIRCSFVPVVAVWDRRSALPRPISSSYS